MTLNGARHRTAAATVASAAKRTRDAAERRATVQREAAEQRAERFRRELYLLDGKWVQALAGVLVAECTMRGLTVPDLLNDEEPLRRPEG